MTARIRRTIPLGAIWQLTPLALALLAGLLIFALDANTALFHKINELGRTTGDTPWAIFSVFADALVAVVLLIPLCGRRPDVLWASVIASLLATLWVHGLKPLLHIPRPAAVLPPDAIHIIGQVLRNSSFPSGHTATAFVLSGVVGLMLGDRRLLAALIVLATLAGMSRVAVGAHWPLDVAAGAFGGWLSALIGIRIAQRWPIGNGITGQRIIAGVLVLCALVLLTVHETHFAVGSWLQRLVALACIALAWPGLRRLFFRPLPP